MSLAELLRRWFRRSDVQSVLAVAAMLILAFAVESALLYAYVAKESLEEADRWVDQALADVRVRSERGDSPKDIAEDLRATGRDHPPVLRLRSSEGPVVAAWGRWPDPGSEVQRGEVGRGFASALRLDVGNYLISAVRLPSGEDLELALPLRHYAKETAEVGHRLAVLWLVSSALAFAAAWIAVFRAFVPLRRATELLAAAPAELLIRRLPSRSTGDPVDRLAEGVNGALDTLDEAFARLRGFSRDVAHELRTPLNRIENVAEVALLAPKDAPLRSALESARDSAAGLGRVVQSLLLLAETDDRRLAIRRTPIDADARLALLSDLYGPLFEERNKSFIVTSRVGPIEADPMLLDRVLVNLVENALEHTLPGARVELEAVRAADELCICIDDSGPGIPVDRREQIFERRAHGEPGLYRRSFGLGLPLARATSRLLGGELVAGDSPLGGARFLLRIPLHG